ncbi:peroxiredoxin-2-like [Arctopsyche grandis]|uniref:peroxiredoxin-2-like n=1 Tax=Arctopsyche grandis TaxID=121162 RepID=UPI00406D8A37
MSSLIRNLSKQLLTSRKLQLLTPFNFIHTGTRLLAPRVQLPAPNFKGPAVINGDFKDIALKDYLGKYVVLVFYPLDFTFVCPTELVAFSDKAEDFKKIGCEVIGVSTDSKFSHLAWTQTSRKDGGVGKLNIPLLADFTKEISKAYDVLIEGEGIALRGLFIIDKDGILRQMTVNDLPVGRSVDETLRLVKAFQFADKHGEVCPANWHPEKNSATIKPDPAGSKDYFKKANS